MSRETPSILDVARAAGVSGMTVSRVLNGQPHVRAATKARVLAAMEELRFRPSRAARALSTKRSQTIGLLAAAGPHHGQASCVRAVEDAARQRGYYPTVARLGADSPDALAAAVRDLLDQDVEGIVIAAPRAGVMSRLAPLAGDVPVVAAPGASSGHDRGARMMMR